MRISQRRGRWPGRPGRKDVAWGDERQVAVLDRASAQTLYVVVMLIVVTGFTFDTLDPRRYGPCATVLFVIALGSTFVARAVARHQGVEAKAPPLERARLVAQSLVFGVVFSLLARHFHWSDYTSWPNEVLVTAGYAVGYGYGDRSVAWAAAAWRQRRALRRPGGPGTGPDAPEPLTRD
jgi:hypothetical protein